MKFVTVFEIQNMDQNEERNLILKLEIQKKDS